MMRSVRQENLHTEIFTPSIHQVDLLDKAIKRNTIVCLSSTSGKSFITVLLVKQLADQIRCNPEKARKKSVVLVQKDEVIKNQGSIIKLHTDVSVCCFGGWNGSQNWTKERWVEELDGHQVVVMQPGSFCQLLQEELLKLSNINLLVLDECQSITVTGHPYDQIMQYYKDCEDKPRILGLTASLLKNHQCRTPAQLENQLTFLEEALDSHAETASDVMLVASVGAKPQEIILQCDDYHDKTGLMEKFKHILDSALYFLESYTHKDAEGEESEKNPTTLPLACLRECYHSLVTLGPWCAGRVAGALVKQLDKLLESEKGEWQKRFLHLTRTQLHLVDVILTKAFDNEVMCLEDFHMFVSPKVLKLVDILHEYKPDDNFMIIAGDDSLDDLGMLSDGSVSDFSDEDEPKIKEIKDNPDQGIHYVAVKKKPEEGGPTAADEKEETVYGLVFVSRRHVAFALNKLLEELCVWDTDLYFLKSHHITGHGVSRGGRMKGGENCETLYKQQEDIMRKFRQREYNLLVTTAVLEEGVDVPKCNLIVRFADPVNYRSYVQSKGRARAPNAKFYMLVEDSASKSFHENLQVFKGFEKLLCHKLQEEQDPQGKSTTEIDQLLPPYKPSQDETAPQVSMSSAIALVNRYCAKLPSDAFTHLVPKSMVEEKVTEEGYTVYQATLQLPINSPVKLPIQGEWMRTKKLAHMAVALKTCEVLHEKGELDDQFLPVGKEMIRYEDEDNEWEETEASGQARPGTTKRKQYFLKRTAEALFGQPRPEKQCYLYVFNLNLTCPISEEQNTRGRKIHAPEETPRGFGIISEKRIPLVPHFPVFTRSGEVTVAIDLIDTNLVLSVDKFKRLTSFHRFVFTKVLRLEKDPMVFRPHEASSSYVLVPLVSEQNQPVYIDWDFIKMIEDTPMKTSQRRYLFESDKEKFTFRVKDFEDAVVMPSYRNIDQPQYFYVAEIRNDLSPKSPFPSPELFDTFEHYYNTKYGLSVTNVNQPLLDVDHTSARLNLLTPRYMNQKGVALPTSSAETRRAKRENLQQKQILVPELCDIHPFPASLWRKAVCIPAILYRLNYLLIADEIRIMISQNAHIGVAHLPVDHRFSKVEFVFPSRSDEDLQKDENNSNCTESMSENSALKRMNKTSDNADTTGSCLENDNAVSKEDMDTGNNEDSGKNDSETVCGIDTDNSESESSDKDDTSKDHVLSGEKGNTAETMGKSINKQETVKSDLTVAQKNSQALVEAATSNHSPESSLLCGTNVTDQSRTTLPETHNAISQELSTSQNPEVIDSFKSTEPCSKYISPSNSTDNAKSCVSENISQDISVEGSDNMIAKDKSPMNGERVIENNKLKNHVIKKLCNNILQDNGLSDQDISENILDVAVNAVQNHIKCNSSQLKQGDQHINSSVCQENQCSSCETSCVCNGGNKELEIQQREIEKEHSSPMSRTTTAESMKSCDNIQLSQTSKKESAKFEKQFGDGETEGKCQDEETKVKSNQDGESQINQSHGADMEQIEKGMSAVSLKESSKRKYSSSCREASRDDYSLLLTFEDDSIDLDQFVGPSPSIILQTLTMSNANDFFNLERLETIGDSFLKFAITVYLYCTYPGIHEGKLSYLRSKQVSNYNLYRLGKKKCFPECMVASKFEPSENWLPPGFIVKREGAFKGLEVYVVPTANLNERCTGARVKDKESEDYSPVDFLEDTFDVGNWDQKCEEKDDKESRPVGKDSKSNNKKYTNSSWREDILKLMNKSSETNKGKENPNEDDGASDRVKTELTETDYKQETLNNDSESKTGKSEIKETENVLELYNSKPGSDAMEVKFYKELQEYILEEDQETAGGTENKILIPYNLQTQHSLPDKSIADCVEALIGCYLTSCGQRAALQFMAWLGLKVLPSGEEDLSKFKSRTPFGLFEKPPSPLLVHVPSCVEHLNFYLDGYDAFEEKIQYKFRDRSYLLQAFTHASYHYNNITDCYQRLEFLGDAILDYVITRHLFEDSKKHSPGILTDLRSALVNNNIFAALAVKWDFHKYFKAISPHLFFVINKFVQWQKDRNDQICLEEEFGDEEKEEDIEIPKALGDIFESVAGAIYLDSGLSLDEVWRVYFRIMKPYIDSFTTKIPKSPVRELLEMEPETAKFERPERTMDGKIRVTVTVVGKGSFCGVGRNYRIAKSAAAKRALKSIKLQVLVYQQELAKLEQRNMELAASLMPPM